MSAGRELLVLLRLRVRLLLRRGVRRYTRSARLAAPLRSLALLVVVLAFLAQMIVVLTLALGGALSGDQGRRLIEPLLAAASFTATLLIFLYGMLAVVAALTYRSDLGLLLLTPLPPRLVLGEKLFSVGGSFALLLLVLGGPILIAGGRSLHLGPVYALATVLALLLLPVLPVSLAMLITLAILRWLPPARARTMTTVMGWVSGAAFYIGSQLLAGRAAGSQVSATSISEGWWSVLPPAWPGRALAATALGQPGTAMAYFLGTALLGALLTWLTIELAGRLFATGWATYGEVGALRRRGATRVPAVAPMAAQPADFTPASRGKEAPRRAWRWLIRKEWLTLRRDPAMLARLAYVLLLIGFIVYRNVVSRSPAAPGSGSSPLFSVGILDIMLTVILIFLLSILALSIVNREGRSLYLLALAPLSPREIVLSKWAFCVTPVLVLVEGILVASALTTHLAPGQVILSALALAGVAVAVAGQLILVSLIWPRLQWDNPRQQVSGLATLVGDLGGLIVGGGACLLLFVAFAAWSSVPLVSVIAALGIFALTGLVTGAVWFLAPRRLQALLLRE